MNIFIFHFSGRMELESMYDYGDEDQDFYEESPSHRKGYPIDHRSIKVSNRFRKFLFFLKSNFLKVFLNFL